MREQLKKELLRMVVKNYQNIVENIETEKETLWPEIIKIVSSIEQGKILDVGCGDGKIYELLRNKQISYTGVDNCDKIIEVAKQKINDPSQNNPKFILGDILKLNKISQINFDYLFCINVLHHIPSKQLRLDALRQLKNKIKPNGEIILTVQNFWNQKKYRKLIIKFLTLKIFKKNEMDFADILIEYKNHNNNYTKCYYHAFTSREIKKIIKQTNLKIKWFYKDKKTYYLMLTK